MSVNLNTPAWPEWFEKNSRNPKPPRARGPFQEVWYLRVNDVPSKRAFWIRFTLLVSSNGFRRIAETWVITADRSKSKELQKIALNQTHPIQAFSFVSPSEIRIGDCTLSETATRGSVQSKGQTIAWDLKLRPFGESSHSFNSIAESLRGVAGMGLIRSSVVTVAEDLRVEGTLTVNGETVTLQAATGMQGHLSGPNKGHSWVWAHGNSFRDEKGAPASFIFEGLSARARILGPLPSPRISAFYFRYREKDYLFNTLLDTFRLRSRVEQGEWRFQAEVGDLSFRGFAKSENKDFLGITYEDTNGSLLYCSHCLMADLEIVVYRRGKIETALYATGSGSLEIVDREKSPYVPLLL